MQHQWSHSQLMPLRDDCYLIVSHDRQSSNFEECNQQVKVSHQSQTSSHSRQICQKMNFNSSKSQQICLLLWSSLALG